MKGIADLIESRWPKDYRCEPCAPAEKTTRHGAPATSLPGVETARLPRSHPTVREKRL